MSSHLHQVNQKKLEIYQLEHELIDIKEYCDDFQLPREAQCYGQSETFKRHREEIKQEIVDQIEINESISLSDEMVTLAEDATLSQIDYLPILQENINVLQSTFSQKRIETVQKNIDKKKEPYNHMPMVKLLNNLKEEDLQEKNELLKSYKNKQEMENQLGTIVESDRKSDQDFNADLEKIDISLFELTAEDQRLSERLNAAILSDNKVDEDLVGAQREFVELQTQLSELPNPDTHLSPLRSYQEDFPPQDKSDMVAASTATPAVIPAAIPDAVPAAIAAASIMKDLEVNTDTVDNSFTAPKSIFNDASAAPNQQAQPIESIPEISHIIRNTSEHSNLSSPTTEQIGEAHNISGDQSTFGPTQKSDQGSTFNPGSTSQNVLFNSSATADDDSMILVNNAHEEATQIEKTGGDEASLVSLFFEESYDKPQCSNNTAGNTDSFDFDYHHQEESNEQRNQTGTTDFFGSTGNPASTGGFLF